jgi:hypothetical protein
MALVRVIAGLVFRGMLTSGGRSLFQERGGPDRCWRACLVEEGNDVAGFVLLFESVLGSSRFARLLGVNMIRGERLTNLNMMSELLCWKGFVYC